MGFPGGSDNKDSAYNAGDLGSIPGSGRSSGEGNGNPLLYSCLGNPMDRGACWATVHGVTKRHDWVTNTFAFIYVCIHIHIYICICVYIYIYCLVILFVQTFKIFSF